MGQGRCPVTGKGKVTVPTTRSWQGALSILDSPMVKTTLPGADKMEVRSHTRLRTPETSGHKIPWDSIQTKCPFFLNPFVSSQNAATTPPVYQTDATSSRAQPLSEVRSEIQTSHHLTLPRPPQRLTISSFLIFRPLAKTVASRSTPSRRPAMFCASCANTPMLASIPGSTR